MADFENKNNTQWNENNAARTEHLLPMLPVQQTV